MTPERLTPGAPRHVVVAGGGFAAVEALLALRDLAGDAVTLELLSPEPLLHYRPSATGEPFGADEVQSFALSEIAERAGAAHRVDALASVAPRSHTVRLVSGATRGYDGLVLALGARRRVGVPGAVLFRDQRDTVRMRTVVADLVEGRARRVAFVVPVGVSWTLPLYELALLTARALEEAGAFAEVALVTPEHRPLEVFGDAASRTVHELLLTHGIRVITEAHADAATRDGLILRFGGMLRADRVVALPRLAGPDVPGIPGDWSGFVPTDDHGGVEGLPDVFAIGDMTDSPVKQGGLATQAADTVAATVASMLGVGSLAEPEPPVLRARLLGPVEPLYLRTQLDGRGRPLPGGSTAGSELPWWPSGKVVGRYLSPALADLVA
jgi:sulfide:quinone oxidoreductase